MKKLFLLMAIFMAGVCGIVTTQGAEIELTELYAIVPLDGIDDFPPIQHPQLLITATLTIDQLTVNLPTTVGSAYIQVSQQENIVSERMVNTSLENEIEIDLSGVSGNCALEIYVENKIYYGTFNIEE